jgi:hypothetical protein
MAEAIEDVLCVPDLNRKRLEIIGQAFRLGLGAKCRRPASTSNPASRGAIRKRHIDTMPT